MALNGRFPTVRILRPLGHTPFALLWGGQTFSSVGNAITEIALAWLVYELTGSALEMGTILALFNLPMLLLVLFGGVLADRMPRRTILLASDVARCLVMLGASLLVASGQTQVWHLQALAILAGAAAAFFIPAYSSVLPDLVPTEELVAANSLNTASQWLAGILGPLLGAWLVATGGIASAFAFDAGTYVLSSLCLLGVPSIMARAPEDRSPVWREVADGFRAVLGSTWLWFTIAIFALIAALHEGPMLVLLPKLVMERLGGEVEALGMLRGAQAAGLALGVFFMGQRGMPRLRGIWLYAGTAAAGLTVAGFGVTESLVVGLALAAINGATWAVVEVIWEVSIQEMVPNHLRGRVKSVDYLGALALMPLALWGTGLVAEMVGTAAVFVVTGLAIAILAVASLFIPDIRRFGTVVAPGSFPEAEDQAEEAPSS